MTTPASHTTEACADVPIGPDYKQKDEKPKATVSGKIEFDTVHVLPQTPQLIALLTYV